MEMNGEREIAAPRQVVYDALNDPEVLKESIPGCETVERTSDTSFTAKVALKVGPVKAKFTGDVSLEDLNPPESYSLVGKGKGGPAGFASGRANVALAEQNGGTLLSYTVDVEIGGKIAQLGSRLIDGTANRLSGEFFDKFSAIAEERSGISAPVTSEEDTADVVPITPQPVAEPAQSDGTATAGSPSWVWWGVGGAAIVVAAAIILS